MRGKEVVEKFTWSLNAYLAWYIVLLFIFALLYFINENGFKGLSGFSDAVYFSVVTATTLGFGDISPSYWVTKLLVSTQVLSSVLLVGLFLNSLSFAQSERIRSNENRLDQERKEGMRDGLDRHISLLVEALKTSNYLIWDKHAIHCAPLINYKDYMLQLGLNLKKEGYIIDQLRIKILLECSDQMYDSFVALLPVAADISPGYLMRWSSIVSNVRNLRNQYRDSIRREPFNGEWPATSSISLQLEEILNSALFLSEPLDGSAYA
jgi:hypothetical protein